MSELSLNGNPISWHIGFFYRSRFYWYMPVYKTEFHKFSPGQTLLYLCIEDALNKGAVVFDFLRGGEGYKNHLAESSDELYEFKLHSKELGPTVRNFFVNSIKLKISPLGRKL